MVAISTFEHYTNKGGSRWGCVDEEDGALEKLAPEAGAAEWGDDKNLGK